MRPGRQKKRRLSARALARGTDYQDSQPVEGLGQLARWTLTIGQTQAQALIGGIATVAVIADKAFDAAALITAIEQSGAKAVIPPKSNRVTPREFDRHL